MGLDAGEAQGQTPLDEDEKDGLLVTTISTRGELDEFEQLGIERAVEWTRRRKLALEDILTEDFVKVLHRRMFGDIWKWAGEFRTSNKNLGVDKSEIRGELKKLMDDCRYWIERKVYGEDEIAVRFSHRIASIHPFANGNGRHCRLIADILVEHGLSRPHFSWGSTTLTAKGEVRAAYLAALRKADENNYQDLVKFARS